MVRLDRTAADTFSYYARTRTAKAFASVTLLAVLAGTGVWQYPTAAAAVQDWAAGLSGRDEALAAQSALSDALNRADDVTASIPADSGIDSSQLTSLRDECSASPAGEPAVVAACADRLTVAADALAGTVRRHDTATQILALEQKAADAKRDREEAAAAAEEQARQKAAADAAAKQQADEAARRAAAEARQQQQQQQQQSPPAVPAPPKAPSGSTGGSTPSKPSAGTGSALSTTVTCNSRQTVTASATGGGTVTVTISGAGSASRSGGGSAVAQATGLGTFTITAKSTAGGLTLNPSWTGACW